MAEGDRLPDGELPLSPIGPANEDAAFRLVARRLEALLGAYPTSTVRTRPPSLL